MVCCDMLFLFMFTVTSAKNYTQLWHHNTHKNIKLHSFLIKEEVKVKYLIFL